MDFKKTFSSLLIAAGILFFPQKIKAAGPDEAIFKVWADKTIKNPQTNQWLESLGGSATISAPDSPLEFKIRVKNQSDQPLTNIKVTDTLPPLIVFIAGPGEYRQESRQITWSLPSLNPHQEAIFDVYAKTASADQFPQATTCLTNRVDARAETGDFYFDTVRFCLGKPMPGVAPETGLDPHLALQALGCLSLMGLGLKLRKYR